MKRKDLSEGLDFKQDPSVLLTATAKVYWQTGKIIRLDIIRGSEIEAKHVNEYMDAVRLHCNGQPRFGLIDARGNWTMVKEAREMMSVNETIRNMNACAFIVDLLAIRLIVNFFIREGKLESSVKVFGDESTALEWLNKKASGEKTS